MKTALVILAVAGLCGALVRIASYRSSEVAAQSTPAQHKSIQPEELYQVCGPPSEDIRKPNADRSYMLRVMNYDNKGIGFVFARPIIHQGKKLVASGDWTNIKLVELPSGDQLLPSTAISRMGCIW